MRGCRSLKITSPGKTADVQFGVMMTARIAATDEHPASTLASHVDQRHGLGLEQKVRDWPGHRPSKRGTSRRATALSPIFCIRSAIRRVTPYGSIRPPTLRRVQPDGRAGRVF